MGPRMASVLKTILERTEATIILYMDAIDALVSGGVEEYTLDTGQSIQRVTKLDLEKLQVEVDRLMNRCTTLSARINGGNVSIVRPVW